MNRCSAGAIHPGGRCAAVRAECPAAREDSPDPQRCGHRLHRCGSRVFRGQETAVERSPRPPLECPRSGIGGSSLSACSSMNGKGAGRRGGPGRQTPDVGCVPEPPPGGAAFPAAPPGAERAPGIAAPGHRRWTQARAGKAMEAHSRAFSTRASMSCNACRFRGRILMTLQQNGRRTELCALPALRMDALKMLPIGAGPSPSRRGRVKAISRGASDPSGLNHRTTAGRPPACGRATPYSHRFTRQ